MGSLVQTPLSEVTATLELLAQYGVTTEDFAKFRSGRASVAVHLANLFRHGELAITEGMQRAHFIDGDAEPEIPAEFKGWKVIEHRRCGRFRWHPDKVILEQTKTQVHTPEGVDAATIRKELIGTPLNANVLWYLYKRPWLIPPAWKNVLVYFWGTIFQGEDNGARYRGGRPCVFSLQWFPNNGENDSHWRINKDNLKVSRFSGRDAAAVRAFIQK